MLHRHESGSRVRFLVNLQYMTHADLRISLCRGETRVTEQLLDPSQVRTTFEQMRRERMAERVWTNFMRASDLGDSTRQDVADTPIGQSTASGVHE